MRVTFTFDIALPDLDFKVTVYFLVFVLALKVFLDAVNLDASFVTLMAAVFVAATYSSSPANLTVAFKEPVFVALRVTVATPFELVIVL